MSEKDGFELEQRAPIYAWLSRILAREVQATDWDALRDAPLRSILVRVEPGLEEPLASELTATEEEDLHAEFARLFLLPGGVPPFATHWAADAAHQDHARNAMVGLVESSLRAVGRDSVRMAPWGRLPKDHIAVIFDLVAQAQGSSELRDRELAAHLDRELLGPWIGTFGIALCETANHPLFRAIGRILVELHPCD